MCNQNRLTWVCWWSRRSQVTTLTEPTQILEQSGNKAEEPGWNGPLGAWVCKVSTPKCRCYCHERVRSQNEQINVCFRKNRNPQKKPLREVKLGAANNSSQSEHCILNFFKGFVIGTSHTGKHEHVMAAVDVTYKCEAEMPEV